MLHRKLIRDLWLLRGPVLAIALVLASGVATFVMSLCTLSTLNRTLDAYYERYRFADVNVRVKRAPVALAARLAALPGVKRVETRIIQSVNLSLDELDEPANARLLSLPDYGEPRVNALVLKRGRWPELTRPQEVLVSDGFATANQLQPGARIDAILNGRLQTLEIVGIALSPEFIYQIREGDIIPDHRRFAILWMRRRALEAAFQMDGAFNDAAFQIEPGTSIETLISRIDLLSAAYGSTGAYGRNEQPSHKFITNELSELQGMAFVVPTIFLLVAAWLLQVVVSRLIGTQREQIATLKAFGLTNAEIGSHYLQMVLVMAWLGGLVGIGMGAWMGRGVATMYSRFFHFPDLHFQLDGRVVLAAVAISTLAALAAVAHPVWKAMRLPPAEAMRPELPPAYGSSWIEQLAIFRHAATDFRMIARQMLRRPGRAVATCLGIGLAVAMLILGAFMLDGLDVVLETEFYVAQRQDMMLTFVEPTDGRVLAEAAHLPGVLLTEPFRSVPVRLRVGHRTRRLGLMGLTEHPRLFRVTDINRTVHSLPAEGILLSASLAEVLEVKPGEYVTVEVQEGRRPVSRMRLIGVVEDFKGQAAYAQLDTVRAMMQEGDTLSGVFLQTDALRSPDLSKRLMATPHLASATRKGAALQSMRETIVANILRMRAFNVGFACVIACGVVYNSARITLAERSRELATLRVIGFTRREITGILLGELGILTLLAIPLGLMIGHQLAAFVIWMAYDTELFRIPLVISRWTDAFASSVTLMAALGTSAIVSIRLSQLDLVAVLKTRE